MPLIGLTLHGICGSGPWGDAQVVARRQDNGHPHGRWLSTWMTLKEVLRTTQNLMKAKCESSADS